MDENFIPYEQIAPLVRPGMTAQDLAKAIVEAAGLPLGAGYNVLAAEGTDHLPVSEAIKRGVFIVHCKPPSAPRGHELIA